MLKHLLGWLQEFLNQHKQLELFNDIQLSVPAYLDMSKPRCAYEEVSRWNGGEIKTMTRFLVGGYTQYIAKSELGTESAMRICHGVYSFIG